MTPEQLLALPMQQPNDADAPTIRDFLKALLVQLIRNGEGFNGKRPFGNSGWDFDLYFAMIRGGAIPGKLDECGYVDKVDCHAADLMLIEAIKML